MRYTTAMIYKNSMNEFINMQSISQITQFFKVEEKHYFLIFNSIDCSILKWTHQFVIEFDFLNTIQSFIEFLYLLLLFYTLTYVYLITSMS